MLNAIIRQGDITLIAELPKSLIDLRLELLSSGVRSSPSDIKLFDDEGDIEVQVFSDQPLGQHLGAMLTTDDTLATANLAAYAVLHHYAGRRLATAQLCCSLLRYRQGAVPNDEGQSEDPKCIRLLR